MKRVHFAYHRTDGKMESVKGYQSTASPHLVIFKNKNGWSLTHLHTGYCVASLCRRKDANELATLIVDLFDWSMGDDIFVAIEKDREASTKIGRLRRHVLCRPAHCDCGVCKA